MIKGTFCDWLMMKGVRFHPKTVIVETTQYYKYFDNQSERAQELLKGKYSFDFPPFPFLFIERNWLPHGRQETGGDNWMQRLGSYFHEITYGTAVELSEYYMKPPTNYWDDPSTIFAEDVRTNHSIYKYYVERAYWDRQKDYTEAAVVNLHIFKDGKSISSDDLGYHSQHIEPDLGWLLMIAQCEWLSPIGAMHNRPEIELVDWPRNFRRRMKRKTGKEPSPYFRIINPEATQKRYEGDRPSQKTNIKMPLHIVRGHFRKTENHPIEHFNHPSKWIPSHTRGDKKLGTLTKGYTIRLPETDL